MINWKIEKRNIEDLQGYDKNPRKFTDKGLKDLKKSLQNCGDANIITINADNTVLGGHARLTVMKQLGYTEVDVKVPEKQLTEKQVQEVVVRLNANTAGEWDLDKLQADFELDELQEWGLDIEFETLEEEKEIVEDEVPKEVETRAKRGDIWQLGEHRLMCGDSTSITDVEKLMNGEKADMVFTDPPYGMNAVSKSGVLSKNYKTDILNDSDNQVAIDCFNLVQSLYKDIKQVWWGANYYTECLPGSECWIVWDKNNGASDQTDCELAWANFRSVVRQFTLASEKRNRVHPTQKPVELIKQIFNKFEKENKFINVLDLFGGSGSTLSYCEQTNRKCFMMELDEHYCDVIITRWENLTGQKAVLCS
jgi:DNA modification methylase